MDQEQPSPPEAMKPWYYQDWFLFPMFIFWPLWAVLIIRSPWHNSIRSGAVAWAMIFIGLYLIVFRQLMPNGQVAETTVAWIAPGLFLTVVTQIHWTMYRGKVRAAMREPPATDQAGDPDGESSSPRARGRRRSQGRRPARAGRPPRSRR